MRDMETLWDFAWKVPLNVACQNEFSKRSISNSADPPARQVVIVCWVYCIVGYWRVRHAVARRVQAGVFL